MADTAPDDRTPPMLLAFDRRLDGLAAWSDPAKVLLVTLLTIPFAFGWLWRSMHLLDDLGTSPYVSRAYLPNQLFFLWIQLAGQVLLGLAALVLVGRVQRAPWLVHALIQFWMLCASFTLYSTGLFTTPHIVMLVVLPVVGYLLFDAFPMHLGLATLVTGTTAGFVAPFLGLVPYAPFFEHAPFADGKLHPNWVFSTGLPSLFMVGVGLVVHVHLVGRLRARQAELERLSSVDGLTGLANRTVFFERLAEEIARAKRHGHALSVLMVDVDHFKSVNDTYGHLVGDRVLRSIATALREALRTGDLGARYGGEEFAVLLPHTPLEQARLVAERLREALRVPVGNDGVLRASVSLGLAAWRTEEDADEVVARADAALYEAKHQGRDRVELSVPPPAPPD